MRKSICIFLLAVFLPGIVLGWLALRSAEEQQIILERRTAELYQKQTDAVAEAARGIVDEQRRAFSDAVGKLLAAEAADRLARDFSVRLAGAWPRKAIGFALDAQGKLLSPAAQAASAKPEWEDFLVSNSAFLSGKTPAQVFSIDAEELNRPEYLRKKNGAAEDKLALAQADVPAGAALQSPKALAKDEGEKAPTPTDASVPAPATSTAARAMKPGEKPKSLNKKEEDAVAAPTSAAPTKASPLSPAKQKAAEPMQPEVQNERIRKVAPQRVLDDSKTAALSQLTIATADFRALTAGSSEGVVTRFVQDRLDILFWQHPAQAPQMVFGCLIEAASLNDLWPGALPPTAMLSRISSRSPEFVLALLDDKARPVATQPPGETGRDWKRPFVASEIGEALPHWEAALYLMRPQQLEESAQGVRHTLTFLVAAALGIIALGGWLVVADVRRQMALAQQKTDFVSNVSHELKTPLTSIRMFAELMQNGAGATKHAQYSRIIMVEAERLTRLINNVLDFARIERQQKHYDKRPLDLHALVASVWENQELHLRESGFATRRDADPPPYPVLVDEDAVAQILVNLISNAEKYSGTAKEIELHTCVEDGKISVSVLDRGLGIPPGHERKIFEAFHRAHDSLASGIQGSGLGLTLAQRLAREQGGEIVYTPREGGGSVFTLRLPLAMAAADQGEGD